MSEGVASPCVSICLLNDDDICVGCYRSADEIRLWVSYEPEQREAVNRLAAERGRQLNPFSS
jgi:predicted Fe-S protein YdhL (DUF1289 family)